MMVAPASVLLVEQKSEKGIIKMFCKRCGSKVDPNNPVCPNCGTRVSLSGGNGFWDMAGEPKREIAQQPAGPIVKEKVVVKEVKKSPIIPIAISAAFCFLFLSIMIVGRISAKKTVRNLTSSYESQLNQQQVDYETQIEQLELKIRLLEEEVSKSVEPQFPVRVLRPPTPETKPEGYSSPAGSWLFGFFIEGSATEFKWEKQQKDGTWTAFEFDYRDVDARYGLKIVQDLEAGISKLVAVGLTQESDGNYKCTAFTNHGSESVEVRLTIASNSTPSPSPSITPSPSPIPTVTPDDVTEEDPADTKGTDKTRNDGQSAGWGPWGDYHG